MRNCKSGRNLENGSSVGVGAYGNVQRRRGGRLKRRKDEKDFIVYHLCGGSIGWAVPGFSQSLLHLYGDIQWEERQVKGPVCLEIFGLAGNQSVQVQTNEKEPGMHLP